MSLFEKYPYTNFHELNLDWIIRTIKHLDHVVDDFVAFNKIEWAGQWDASKYYMKWNIVADADGNGFLAVQPVPPNVPLSDGRYWQQVANFDVIYAAFNNRIADVENDVQTLKDLYRPYTTPEDHGAVGDGVTDDTAALQECLYDGAKVILSKKYMITAPLNFSGLHDVTIVGPGTITREADKTFNTIMGSGCDNITIRNVRFEGNGNTPGTSYSWIDNTQAAVILASQCKNILIESCIFTDYNYGIFILGADVEGGAPISYANMSFNGTISECVFYNCNSAIDTYGKDLKIDKCIFYDSTGIAVQIEPNYQLDPTVPNPLQDPRFYTAGAGVVVSDNVFIGCDDSAIHLHENLYGCIVENNVIFDYEKGITMKGANINGVIIRSNALYYQRSVTIDAVTRPWSYPGAIALRGAAVVENNYIWAPVIGIEARGDVSVNGNMIVKPVITAITYYSLSGQTEGALINDNKIIGHVFNTSAWYGSRAIVVGDCNKLIMLNNYAETDEQPIFVTAGNPLVKQMISTTQQTGAITPPSDLYSYSN